MFFFWSGQRDVSTGYLSPGKRVWDDGIYSMRWGKWTMVELLLLSYPRYLDLLNNFSIFVSDSMDFSVEFNNPVYFLWRYWFKIKKVRFINDYHYHQHCYHHFPSSIFFSSLVQSFFNIVSYSLNKWKEVNTSKKEHHKVTSSFYLVHRRHIMSELRIKKVTKIPS